MTVVWCVYWLFWAVIKRLNNESKFVSELICIPLLVIYSAPRAELCEGQGFLELSFV